MLICPNSGSVKKWEVPCSATNSLHILVLGGNVTSITVMVLEHDMDAVTMALLILIT
jgi:hypothetical protein